MNKITKKTAFGAITATGAAALLIGGFAAPAMAADSTDVTSDSSRTSSATDLTSNLSDLFRVGDVSNSSPLVLAPEVGVGDIGGDIGDIGSGNATGSGNDTTAPVLSGNDTSTGNGSGNGNSAGNGSANGNGSGNSASNDVSDVVDNVTDTSVSDVVDNVTKSTVKDVVKDVTDSVNVKDITDDLDLGLDNILGD